MSPYGAPVLFARKKKILFGSNAISFIESQFITGQNEREETTQDAIVTKSAAFASYEINYLTYITATYTRAKRRLSFLIFGLRTEHQSSGPRIFS
jgi:hypothetical protein